MSKRYFIAEWEIDQDNPDYFPSYIKVNNGQLTLLSEVDSADVGGAIHGKWICEDYVALVYCCSECGKTSRGETNYCSNCGAKMDKE